MTRITSTRYAIAAFITSALIISAAPAGDRKRPVVERPNFLVVVSDNQGWNDIGYHGSSIRTPHLDRMASAGCRLNHHYVYPMCSPTRAAFIAGRAPSRYGINGAIGNRSRQSLPVDTTTIADVLKSLGYETAISGKWHLGLRPEVGPRQYGFDVTYGFLHGQIDKLTHRYKNGDRSWHRNDRLIDEAGHSVDLITDEAVRFIETPRSKPFFLYVPYGAPHPPLQEDATLVASYDNTFASPSRRAYAAAVTHMDQAVGRLLAALESTDQRANTMVLFFSDNGAIENWPPQTKNYNGRFGPYPELGDNGPLRGWIGELYDGCVRTPAFVYWPGVIPEGTLDDVLSALDWFPTFIELAGGKIEPQWKLEGRDVGQRLRGEGQPLETVLYWRNYNGTVAAVRDGRWKLVVNRRTENVELFDMQTDPEERNNRAVELPNQVAALRKLLVAQAALDLD